MGKWKIINGRCMCDGRDLTSLNAGCTNNCRVCCANASRGIGINNDNKYSVLGGVVAPKNSAYAISSMSNPSIERPTTKIDRSLPSLRDRGAIGNIENFNPYNSQYRSNVNFNQVNKSIPKSFGGNFTANVQLENPTGSPVLQSHGINTGGYGAGGYGGGTPQAKEMGGCPLSPCKRPRGFLMKKEKAPCLKDGMGGCRCTFKGGSSIGCGRQSSAMVRGIDGIRR